MILKIVQAGLIAFVGVLNLVGCSSSEPSIVVIPEGTEVSNEPRATASISAPTAKVKSPPNFIPRSTGRD